MTEIELAPLIERLKAKRPAREVTHTGGGGLCYTESDHEVLVNPDGPEAADKLEALSGRRLVDRLTEVFSGRRLPGTRNGPITEPRDLAEYVAAALAQTQSEG